MRKMSRVALLLVAVSAAFSLLADEGMWTYDNFPAAKMRAKYGWAPDAAWLKERWSATARSFCPPPGTLTRHVSI
jgi:hypothetical protein